MVYMLAYMPFRGRAFFFLHTPYVGQGESVRTRGGYAENDPFAKMRYIYIPDTPGTQEPTGDKIF